MVSTQPRIVYKFFFKRRDQLDVIVRTSLENLFVLAPEAMAAFQGDAQRYEPLFAGMLRKMIELTRVSSLWPVTLKTGNAIIIGLDDLKAHHERVGVTRKHFNVMKIALLQALEQIFQDDFTPEVQSAFIFVFNALTKSLTTDPDSMQESDALQKLVMSQDKEASWLELADVMATL